MPNWCYTNITISHEDKNKVEDLYNKIKEWTSKNYMDNGFGHNWLGNIVLGAEIGTVDEKAGTDVRCRGSLFDLDMSDRYINLATETAWNPMLRMWRLIIDKYLPGAELIYHSEEPGCEGYYTNDDYYASKYYFDCYDVGDYEPIDDLTYDDCVALLQEILGTKETDDMDKLLKMFNEQNDDDAFLSIHKWEWADIDEWE